MFQEIFLGVPKKGVLLIKKVWESLHAIASPLQEFHNTQHHIQDSERPCKGNLI